VSVLPATSRRGEGPNLRRTNAQRKAEGLETSAKVWELKKAGLSFRQIGLQIGLSPSGAHEAYKRVIRALKEELAENADDWLHLEIGRLEEAVAFQIRVMRGLDVRPKELKERDPIKEGEEDKENPERETPPLVFPSIEERLAAARDVVKSGESLRKMLGIDAPEKSDVNLTGIVGTVDLTELAGEELEKETGALIAGLKTLPEAHANALLGIGGAEKKGDPDTIDVTEASSEAQPADGQPQEV
jgi:hypothetical protein